MSVQATSWVIEHSKHSGGSLLIMLMIANHAHADGTGAYPSTATLAKECRMTDRQVRRLLPELEASGELVVFWSHGRRSHEYAIAMGDRNSDVLLRLKREYALKTGSGGRNSDKMTLLAEPGQNVQVNPDNISTLTRTSEPPNPDICAPSTRTSAPAHIKEEPSLEPSVEKRGRAASPKHAADKRKDHPAIVAIREIASLYPPKEIWDLLIDTLGDRPDVARLKECWLSWRTRGFKPTNYAWALEWYPGDIPAFGGTNGNGSRPFDAGKPDPAELATLTTRDLKPQRPPADCPPEQKNLWLAFCDHIRTQVSPDVFQSWFKPLIFDGLDKTATAFKVRARPITHDWITKYYSQLLYDAFIATGLAEFTIKWEVEEEQYVEAQTA